MSIIISEDKNKVRRYLLGQLEEAEEERLELRLLTDPSFGEEFDTVVDEIADQYAGNEIEGEERGPVEQYFMRSAERQQKVRFSRELLERAASERAAGERRHAAVAPAPGFFESVQAFWRNQSFVFRTATALATIVIVVGLGYLASRRATSPGTLASLTLSISTSDRASGAEVKSVKLEPGTRGLRIELALPDQVPQSQNYRVELVDDQQRAQNLTISERTDKSLFVEIPEITRGQYIIQLYGDERRIRGSYYFNIE